MFFVSLRLGACDFLLKCTMYKYIYLLTLVCCCWQDDTAEGGVVYASLQTPPAKPPRATTVVVQENAPETEYGTVVSAWNNCMCPIAM